MSQFAKLFCLLSLTIAASAGLIQRLDEDGFTQVFDGTGTDPTDRDASVEGDGYLTFTVVTDRDSCLDFCKGVETCVFVNFYAEFNDPSSPQPALKCAAYDVTHTVDDKLNFGGETLDESLGPTYIQQSEGWALDS